MSLSGTFETLPIPEVLGLLAGSNKTGGLRLESGDDVATVFMRDGACIAADGVDHEGPVDSEHDLEARLVEVCFEIARRESGSFSFDAEAAPQYDTRYRVDVSNAVAELVEQLEQWEAIREVIPSIDHRPRLNAALETDTIEFDAERWKLAVALDGRRSVRQVVQKLEGTLIDVSREIAALIEVGAVTMSKSARSTSFAAVDVDDDEPAAASPSLIVPSAPYGPGVDDADDGDTADAEDFGGEFAQVADRSSDDRDDESDEDAGELDESSAGPLATVFDQDEVDAAIDAALARQAEDDGDSDGSDDEGSGDEPSIGDVTSVEDELEDLEAALGGPLDGLEDLANGDADDVAAAVAALKERGDLPADAATDEVRDRGALLRLFSALRDS